jgi:hypothetical protein
LGALRGCDPRAATQQQARAGGTAKHSTAGKHGDPP